MPDYFVYRKGKQWFAKRNRHLSGYLWDGNKPSEKEIFNIFARTKKRALTMGKKIVENIEKMQVEAQGSTVSNSAETETKEIK